MKTSIWLVKTLTNEYQNSVTFFLTSTEADLVQIDNKGTCSLTRLQREKHALAVSNNKLTNLDPPPPPANLRNQRVNIYAGVRRLWHWNNDTVQHRTIQCYVFLTVAYFNLFSKQCF